MEFRDRFHDTQKDFHVSFYHITGNRYHIVWITKYQTAGIYFRQGETILIKRERITIRYCVINGWFNYISDRIHFWRGLEWLIPALIGAEPRRDDLEWERRYKESGKLGSFDN